MCDDTTSTDRLRGILFAGTEEERERARAELEGLMRAIMERRPNICKEDDDSDSN